MKNILFRINELSKKKKANGLTVDEKQEQQMLRQNYITNISWKLRFHFIKHKNC